MHRVKLEAVPENYEKKAAKKIQKQNKKRY